MQLVRSIAIALLVVSTHSAFADDRAEDRIADYVTGLERMARQAQLAGRRLLVPDENVSWNLTAIPAAIRIVKNEQIDVVITTSPPNSVHLIGAAVQKALDELRRVANDDGPHAHAVVLSPDNRFVFVPDLGLDQVLSYRLDTAKCGAISRGGAKVQ